MIPQQLQGEGFKIDVERHGDYLRAYVFDGHDSLRVSIGMWTMLAELCRRYRVRKLLVVENLESTVDELDLTAIIEAMADCGFADLRTAFVELQDDLPTNERGEILALENGITVRVFSNETEAWRWLVYGGD